MTWIFPNSKQLHKLEFFVGSLLNQDCVIVLGEKLLLKTISCMLHSQKCPNQFWLLVSYGFSLVWRLYLTLVVRSDGWWWWDCSKALIFHEILIHNIKLWSCIIHDRVTRDKDNHFITSLSPVSKHSSDKKFIVLVMMIVCGGDKKFICSTSNVAPDSVHQ